MLLISLLKLLCITSVFGFFPDVYVPEYDAIKVFLQRLEIAFLRVFLKRELSIGY